MRWLAIACVLGVACGDNAHGAADAARVPDAAPDALAQPDLALVGSQMDGTTSIDVATFGSADCEVVDGCVGGAGARTLLRFDTVAENVGTADLDLGAKPPAGSSAGYYQWDTCAGKHLVIGYVTQTVSDATGAVVATGHKEAFCLEDTEQVEPRASHDYTCDHMGISVGWADVYPHDTSCQWVDVTGLGSGTYTLTVTVDPNNALPDANPANNAWTTAITL
jgi:hypothetical protein|nr:lysyl oxidase family protein [Kofleriaceae bacterium]